MIHLPYILLFGWLAWFHTALDAQYTGEVKKPGIPDRFDDQSGAIVRGDKTMNTIALVFTGDLYADGLEHIGRVLQEHNITAAFFLTGNFYRNPEFEPIVRNLLADGHYLGAHSDRHLLYCDWDNRDSLLVTREQFVRDLENNYAEMKEFGITKEDAPYFLPPYEWYNDSITAWTRSLGLRLINYTPGTLSHTDYTVPGTPAYRSSQEILSSILEYERNAPRGLNGFMLLMHAGSASARSDKFYPYLGPLLDTLNSTGYKFVSVAELLQPPPRSPGKGWARNSVNVAVFRRNSIASHGASQFVSFYDSTGRMILARRRIGSHEWKVSPTPYSGNVRDAHNTISIMPDGSGNLHVAWDHHGTPLRYCRSITADTLALTAPMEMIGSEEEAVTYPEFHRLPDGRLIFLYRDGSSGNGNLVINRYDPGSYEWERLHRVLIDGEGERNAYWQAATDSRGTLHLSWVWRESSDVATNHDICYARSRDGGLSWETSEGRPYELPITASTAEYAALIPQESELINQTSMAVDHQGRPFIATYFTPEGEGVPQYHMIHKGKDGWSVSQVTRRKTGFSLSGGGTKKIPISRPQILLQDHPGGKRVYLLFRDQERGNSVTLGWTDPEYPDAWRFSELTGEPLGSWEPTYDTELWKNEGKLHLFVQKAGQGDGETLEAMDPQPVRILEVPLPAWNP